MQLELENVLVISAFNKVTKDPTYNTRSIIKKSISELITQLRESHKYSPTAGDRMWFYPGCTIPRFKVKGLCQKHKIAVVKYKEKATVKFIGKNHIEELSTELDLKVIKKHDLIKFLNTNIINLWMDLINAINASESDLIYLTEYCYRQMIGTIDSIFSVDDLDRDAVEDVECIGFIETGDKKQRFKELLEDPTVFYQDDLLNHLNTGVAMDENMYNNIKRLFKSNDNGNVVIAMEAMANCDYQRSAVWLLLLMRQYNSKIYNSGAKHHINFKTLVKYFGLDAGATISIDGIIDALMRHKLLNINNINILMPYIMDRIRDKGDMVNIKIKDVELTPEVEKAISENVLDQLDANASQMQITSQQDETLATINEPDLNN